MRALILTLVLGTSTVALAEDCSCLEQKVITNECWEFALSSKGDSCQDGYELDDSKRITAVEARVAELEATLRKVQSAQRSAQRRARMAQ